MANLIEYGGADGYANHLRQVRLVDAAGHEASIVSVEHTGAEPQVWVQCGNGPQIMIPVSLLDQESEDAYRLPFSFNTESEPDSGQFTLPVVEEQIHVDKRMVNTGKGIRLNKRVLQREQVVDLPLRRDQLMVEHCMWTAFWLGIAPEAALAVLKEGEGNCVKWRKSPSWPRVRALSRKSKSTREPRSAP